MLKRQRFAAATEIIRTSVAMCHLDVVLDAIPAETC